MNRPRSYNICNLKGEARKRMWHKIQSEHPALAEDLQDGACARILKAFPGTAVIVELDEDNKIITGIGHSAKKPAHKKWSMSWWSKERHGNN